MPAAAPRRRWLLPLGLALVALAAVLLLGVGGAFDGVKAPVAPSATTNHTATVAAQGAPLVADGPAPVAPAEPAGSPAQTAVILPGDPLALALPAAASAPAPAASVNPEAEALSEMLVPTKGRKPAAAAPAHPPRAAAASRGDSDVTLLSALIKHVEVESAASRKARHKAEQLKPGADSIEARMQACPAANTEAGLRCRERICMGHAGDAACPSSVGGA